MGIPRFVGSWIRQLNRLHPGILTRSGPPLVASLSIDLNGVFHEAAQRVYAYGNFADTERAQRIATMDPSYLEHQFFTTITTTIMNLVAAVNPQELVVLAVDGVAPRAKINQQRQRRFRAAADHGPTPAFSTEPFTEQEPDPVQTPVFNSNAITPGTALMQRLDHYLRNWLQDPLNLNLFPPSARIIYSSHLVEGEGEHKIFGMMREGIYDQPYPMGQDGSTGAHIVHGLDADLVLLSLLSPLDRIYLFREGGQPTRRSNNPSPVEFLGVDRLRSVLQEDLGLPSAIPDFVVMTFFLGNDFLPHAPSMEDLRHGLDALLSVYREVGRSLTEHGNIIWPNLAVYMTRLAQIEPDLLHHEAGRSIEYPSEALRTALVTENRTTIEGDRRVTETISTFDYPVFRSLWYQIVMAPVGAATIFNLLPAPLRDQLIQPTTERVKHLCDNYASGLAWVLRYYTLGPTSINTNWYYQYYYTPLFSDLALVLTAGAHLDAWDDIQRSINVNPVYQLLAVLPSSSSDLVPTYLRGLYGGNSPIADQYPSYFLIDRRGKSAAWEGVALIPFADLERIIEAVVGTGFFQAIDSSGQLIAAPFEAGVDLVLPARGERSEAPPRISGSRGRGTSNPRGRGTPNPRGRGTPNPRGRGNFGSRGRGNFGSRGRGTPRIRGRGTPNPRGRSNPQNTNWSASSLLQ